MIEDEIVKWVKKQPYWLQIIANSIFKGDKLDSKSLDKIYIPELFIGFQKTP